MTLRRLAIALALFAGCFSDAPPVDEDDGSTTSTTDPCPPGTLGCACGEAGCGPGLECAPGLELCQEEGCNPGTAGCACLEDDCVGEAVCVGGFCVAPVGTTSTSASDDSPNDGEATSLDATDTTASADTVGDDAVDDTTGGPECPVSPVDMTCTDIDSCMDCIGCALTGPCAGLQEMCTNDMACTAVYACIDGGCLSGDTHTDACINQCCTTNDCTDDKPGCMKFQYLALCVEANCGTPCIAHATCSALSCAVD